MAFLDNSGDIILDAVLTDTGRMRLAKGDGSFKIAKFAIADDEINYSVYNKSHASGSAYFDLEVLKSPVFEAFTNNTSTMKSRLISIPRTNLLYLPELILNEKISSTKKNAKGYFLVAVDKDTEAVVANDTTGYMKGASITETNSSQIMIDQGLNTTEISAGFVLDADLKETQYVIEIDNRLGSIITAGTNSTALPVSFIDDDQIASYYVTTATPGNVVADIPNATDTDGNNTSAITGPRGTRVYFQIKASLELNSSAFLFNQLGSSTTTAIATLGLGAQSNSGTEYTALYVDSNVRVTGITTGSRIDIPIRFIKKN
tara:strand:+ start:6299 stop:7249 length:951 start_codon:yes stop_codon:yes gene_type:complete